MRDALGARGLLCEAHARSTSASVAQSMRCLRTSFARLGKRRSTGQRRRRTGSRRQRWTSLKRAGVRSSTPTSPAFTFNMVQSIGRHWHAAGSPGSIVSLVVSPRGLHQVAHSSRGPRAGVTALTEALAVEWAPLGIRLNCIAPGAIASEGWAVYRADIPQRYAQAKPAAAQLARPGKLPKRQSSWSGPAGRFITGQTLHVNGGTNLWGETWTAGKPAWFSRKPRAPGTRREQQGHARQTLRCHRGWMMTSRCTARRWCVSLTPRCCHTMRAGARSTTSGTRSGARPARSACCARTSRPRTAAPAVIFATKPYSTEELARRGLTGFGQGVAQHRRALPPESWHRGAEAPLPAAARRRKLSSSAPSP